MAVLAAGIGFGLMAIVAVLGPMGTLLTLTLMQRLAYFGIITIVVVLICFSSGFFILYILQKRTVVYVTFALVLMCSVVAAPCSALAMVLYGVFHDGGYPKVGFFGVYSFGVLILSVGTEFAFYVLYQRVSRTIRRTAAADSGSRISPATATVAGSSELDGDGETVQDADHVPAAMSASKRLETGAVLNPGEERGDSASGRTPELRLPPGIGRDIVYAHVSGHYVEVVTTSGTAVVYLRLADVVGALDRHGMQTHRSYWAAYRHIRRVQSDGHRAVLHLTDGHRVPVGRSFRTSVRDHLRQRRTDSPVAANGPAKIERTDTPRDGEGE